VVAAQFRREGRTLLCKLQVKRCKELLLAVLELNPTNLSAGFMLLGCFLELREFASARTQGTLYQHLEFDVHFGSAGDIW